MNRGIKTVATSAFCCLVALTGCKKQQQAMDMGSYKTMTVKTESRELQSRYSASIKGRQDVDIYPQVSGTLQKLCVKEGDRVTKGQTLFIIDQVPYQAALNTAKANLEAEKHPAPVRPEGGVGLRPADGQEQLAERQSRRGTDGSTGGERRQQLVLHRGEEPVERRGGRASLPSGSIGKQRHPGTFDHRVRQQRDVCLLLHARE